jgi:hypothetical protein
VVRGWDEDSGVFAVFGRELEGFWGLDPLRFARHGRAPKWV